MPGLPDLSMSNAEAAFGRKYVSPMLKGGAMAAGGLIGAPLGPWGSAAGVGLAYGIAENIDRMLTGQSKPTVAGESLQSVHDVGVGAATDIGFQTALKGASMGVKHFAQTPQGKYLFDTLPKRMYSSAMKMPLTKKWVQQLSGKEVSKRVAATEEGLRTGVTPTNLALQKAKKLEKETLDAVDDITRELTREHGAIINRDEIIEEGLKGAYERAANSPEPADAKAVVDAIKKKFQVHPEILTPHHANQIKRETYKLIHFGDAESGATGGIMTPAARKGLANQLMKQLESLHDDLKLLNETHAARINLREAIEHTIGRIENTNLVPLGPKFLLTSPKTWPLAFWDMTFGNPQIKSRIAIALTKANPAKYGRGSRLPRADDVPDPFGSGVDPPPQKLLEWKPELPRGTQPIHLGPDQRPMSLLHPEGVGGRTVVPNVMDDVTVLPHKPPPTEFELITEAAQKAKLKTKPRQSEGITAQKKIESSTGKKLSPMKKKEIQKRRLKKATKEINQFRKSKGLKPLSMSYINRKLGIFV